MTTMPTRRAITVSIAAVILLTASAIGTAARGEWGWAATGAACALVFAYEAIRDLRDRRRGRPAR